MSSTTKLQPTTISQVTSSGQLFPPEEPPQQVLPTVQRSKATPIKWSDAERHALATYVNGERMAHKDMEFWKSSYLY